jgi:hypothetical protein
MVLYRFKRRIYFRRSSLRGHRTTWFTSCAGPEMSKMTIMMIWLSHLSSFCRNCATAMRRSCDDSDKHSGWGETNGGWRRWTALQPLPDVVDVDENRHRAGGQSGTVATLELSFSTPSPTALMIFEDRLASGEFSFQSIWIYISAAADPQVGRVIFRYETAHPEIKYRAEFPTRPKAQSGKGRNYCFLKNGMEYFLRSLLKSLCRTRPSKEEALAFLTPQLVRLFVHDPLK